MKSDQMLLMVYQSHDGVDEEYVVVVVVLPWQLHACEYDNVGDWDQCALVQVESRMLVFWDHDNRSLDSIVVPCQ